MFRNFLLSTFRNLWRNKIHSLINIVSLCIGLTVFAFALLYVKQEVSYDRGWPNADNIYRLLLVQHGLPGQPGGVLDNPVARVFPSFTEYFAEDLARASRQVSVPVKLKDEAGTFNDGVLYEQMAFVDPEYVEIFTFELSSGSLDRVMSTPGLIAVSETYAKQHPHAAVLGNVITLESVYQGQMTYEVGAVYRLPQPLSANLNYQLLAPINESSLPIFGQGFAGWKSGSRIWFTLKPGVELSAFNALQPAYIDESVTAFNSFLKPGERVSDHLEFEFQPVTQMHFHPTNVETGGDPARVLTFALVGLLVLLVGCSNSVSLSLAGILERRREIGIRKAAGAVQSQIAIFYLGETVVLAFALAAGMLQLLLPVFTTQLSISSLPVPKLNDFLLLAGIAGLVGLLNGVYPALVLSGVKPELVLKPGATGGNSGSQAMRSLLVGFQFSMAIILLIGTLALYTQLVVVRNQPLGFNPDNLVFLNAGNSLGEQGSTLMQELAQIPGVQHVASVNMMPNQLASLAFNSASIVS